VTGPTDPDQVARWERYARTLISIETAPGRWVDLNGPDGPDRLPWSGPLHVLTAWNPGDVRRTRDENVAVQARLVGELWSTGCFVVRALGRAVDGGYAEESVGTVGLDRAAARRLGAGHRQDAVFEVTDEEVRIVSCSGDAVAARPRRWSH
jgi:hypothetical protein